MDARIDMRLGRQFGVVERTVFRLVISGFTDSQEIAAALSLFSAPVLANAVRHLVNSQILKVDPTNASLYASDPVAAIIDTCLEKRVAIDIPASLLDDIGQGGILVEGDSNEVRAVKSAIYDYLLPGVDLGLYLGPLDLLISQWGVFLWFCQAWTAALHQLLAA